MEEITIAFDGFWKTFDVENNFITNGLRKKFCVHVVDLTFSHECIDALFYSVWSKDFLSFSGVRIFYTGENCFPDFNLCDYAIGFENISVQDRYIRYPISLADFHDDYVLMENKNNNYVEKPFERKFCATVVSNAINTDPFRDDFFYKLSKYKTVDSGGRHLNNIGKPEGVENKIDFLRGYKFSLAFENVSQPGYCTEKLVQSFSANTVPIYWGDPCVKLYFNEKAFIDITGCESYEEALKMIKCVDENEVLYNSMLSEPAIIDTSFNSVEQDLLFEGWLLKIFSQNKENRFRRNIFGYSKIYEKKNCAQMSNSSAYEEFLGLSGKNKILVCLKFIFHVILDKIEGKK